MSSPPQISFGNRIGTFILAEISAASASSIIILLSYIAVRFLNMVNRTTSTKSWYFLTVQCRYHPLGR
jgi:hypothetical protein